MAEDDEDLKEGQGAEVTVDPVLADEARKYGWKDKDEFTLAPDGWVDAERFLELPSTQLKMVRDTKRELEKQLKERDEQFSRIERTSMTAIERVRQQERERYDQQVRDLEAQKRAAVETADTEAFDRAEQARQKLRPPVIEEVPQKQPDYLEAATWTKDPAAAAFAFRLVEDNPRIKYLPPERQVAWAATQVKEHFPELFDEPKQEQAPPRSARVDGGGLGFKTRTRGPDDLPPDVRKIAESFVKEGVYKSVSDYAKDFYEQGE